MPGIENIPRIYSLYNFFTRPQCQHPLTLMEVYSKNPSDTETTETRTFCVNNSINEEKTNISKGSMEAQTTTITLQGKHTIVEPTFVTPECSTKTQGIHKSVAGVLTVDSIDERKGNPPHGKNSKKRVSPAKHETQTVPLSGTKQKRTSGRLKKVMDIKQQTLINFGNSVTLQSRSSRGDSEKSSVDITDTGSENETISNILEDNTALEVTLEEKYAQLQLPMLQEIGRTIEDHTLLSDNSKKPIHPFFENRKIALAEPKEPSSQQDHPKMSLNEDSTLMSSEELPKPTHPFFLRTSGKSKQSPPPPSALVELSLLKPVTNVNENTQVEENNSPSISISAEASKGFHPFFQPRFRTSTPLLDTDVFPLPETTPLQHLMMVEALWPDKDVYAGGHVRQSEHAFGRLYFATIKEMAEMFKEAKREKKEFWSRALRINEKFFGDMRNRRGILYENLAKDENWNKVQRRWMNIKLNPEELENFLRTIWENEQYKTGPCQHLYDTIFESIKYQKVTHPNSNTLSWADKYKPMMTSTFLGNSTAVLYLRDWLKEMQVSPIIPSTTTPMNLDEKKPKKRERKSYPKLAKKRKRAGYDLGDFIVSDSESGDDQFVGGSLWAALNSDDDDIPVRDPIRNRGSDSRLSPPSVIISNMIVLTGPSGVGKTAAIYACAAELGYEVFEIHPGMRRSKKEILAIVGEMAESHLVTFADTGITTSLKVIETIVDRGDDDVDITCLYDENSDRTMKMALPLDSKINPKLEKNVRLPSGIPSSFTSELIDVQQYTPGTVAPKQSLILLEEVDVLFEEDRTFWSGVLQLAQKSKRPIVMTCNDQTLLPALCLQGILDFSIIPSADLVLYLHLICLVEGHFVNPDHLQYLVDILHHDLRRILLALEFWTIDTSIKNASIPEAFEPRTTLDSLTMNRVKRKNDRFEDEGDIGTSIKKQRQEQEYKLHENEESGDTGRLFTNKCDLLSDYLGTKSAEHSIRRLIRFQRHSDSLFKESITLAFVDAWVQVVESWREHEISPLEIVEIWNDLEVIPEENMPLLVDKRTIDKAAMPVLRKTSVPFLEKVFDLSGTGNLKLFETDAITHSPEGLSGSFDFTNQLDDSEKNEGELRPRHRSSNEEFIQQSRVANQLTSISRFLDDISFANVYVTMSQNRFSQVHELDTYTESDDSLIGHTNLWKNPNGYDHWQMEDKIENLLAVLARKVCDVADISTELIVDNKFKPSLKDGLQVVESVRSFNFSKITSSLTPFLTDRTLFQNLSTDGILYHRPYIRLICQLDEDRINGTAAVPFGTRRTRSKTYRKHFGDIQLEEMTAILEAHWEAKTFIENSQLKDLGVKFQQFFEKQCLLSE